MLRLLPALRLLTTLLLAIFGLLLLLGTFIRLELSVGPFTTVLARTGMAIWWGKEWHLSAHSSRAGPFRWWDYIGAFQVGTLGGSWFLNVRWLLLLLLTGVVAIVVRIRKQRRGFPVGESRV